ncbi:MAG: response regulator [Candidatus Delongbacteria bacterium]|nr:response regulator [Candidatus Delongbacteria bacterium]
MDKSDKLKKLEKLMESAGMETGLAAIQSETFQRMAKSVDAPAGGTPSPGIKPRIKTSSSPPSPPAQSYTPSTSFKTESALKETRDQLNQFKTALYGIRTRQSDLLEKFVEEETVDQIQPALDFLTFLTQEPEKWQELVDHPQDFKSQLNEAVISLTAGFSLYQRLLGDIRESLDGIAQIGNTVDEKQFSQAILIVDDSLTQRKIIQSNLESLNYRAVVEAKDSKEALKVLENHARNSQLPKISLITLDKEMGEISGTDCAKIIRHPSFISKFPIYKNIPIIMITSHVDKATIIEASQAGINDFIKKPIDKKTLEEKVKKYL